MRRLKCVAIPAQFGRSSFVWDNVTSFGVWSNYFAEFTIDELVEEVRRNALSTEVTLNSMIQIILSANSDLEITSHWSGPVFRSNNYGYR